MDGRLMDLSFELLMKLAEREVNLLRLAASRAASAEESKETASLFFKSLRARGARYMVRDLYGLGNAV